MAAPYVVLTANPALLKYVPRPGAWMETFKHLMGFLLLFTVIFLMMSLRQDLLLYTIAFLIFVGFACWLWGRYATFERTGPQRSGILLVALLVALLGARLTFVDFRGFLTGEGAELVWQPFDPVKLAKYHEEGRPVMLDFTADWCFNCKTNEKVVYESSGIVDLLARKDVVAMKADLSNDTPETRAMERLRDKLGASSIPFMAIFPGDDWQRPYTFKDIVTRGEVREALDALPAPRQEQASR
jgi:thiol:disulfide interchange protein DsbD